ncbi:hypothetical protein [Ruegeria sp. SCP11]|uniref:hypothetical protein n=1 Tax=Ruegeria sp. SCP11 TaxID=3141378 RepID=UPI00333AAAC0
MAVLLTGCTKRADWHQKMVLYFDTPNGPLTASSVIRVDFTGAMAWAGDLDHDHTDLTGEAVVADLGGRYLFALIEEDAGRMIVRALPPDKKGQSFKSTIRWIKSQTEPLDLPMKLWPRMVTYKDVKNPTSVELVDPANIAAAFDDGYSLSRVTIQVTEEPLTKGRVEAVLISDFFKDGAAMRKAALARGSNDKFFDSLAAELTRNKFIREE